MDYIHVPIKLISLSKKGRPRCYATSPTEEDTIQPISGLISCGGVTRRSELLRCISCTKCNQVAVPSRCILSPNSTLQWPRREALYLSRPEDN